MSARHTTSGEVDKGSHMSRDGTGSPLRGGFAPEVAEGPPGNAGSVNGFCPAGCDTGKQCLSRPVRVQANESYLYYGSEKAGRLALAHHDWN
jgi:hypothetical protein